MKLTFMLLNVEKIVRCTSELVLGLFAAAAIHAHERDIAVVADIVTRQLTDSVRRR